MSSTLTLPISKPIAAVALWVAASFVLYVVALFVAIVPVAVIVDPLLGAIGLPARAGEPGLSIQNGAHTVAWGLLAAAPAAWLGRRLVPELRFQAPGAAVLLAGLALAGVTTTLLDEFVRERYVWFDPEYAGWSVFAGPALVAIALAAWACLALPRERRLLPFLALAAAFLGLGIALLPSVSGLGDGIRASSLPLAVTFAVDVVFAVGTVALVGLGRSSRRSD
jgi:hypothetical protein